MSKLQNIWSFLGRHKYAVVIILTVAIVGFFDKDSFFNRQPRLQHINQLQSEIDACKQQYEEADRKIKELSSSRKAVEKIARERYLMKRAEEDIFIIEDKDASPTPQTEIIGNK